MSNLYQLLGVSKNANTQTIKKAYRKLVKQYHPDINKDPGAEEKLKEINYAFEILSDPENRARYDQNGEDGIGDSNDIPNNEDTWDENLFSDLLKIIYKQLKNIGLLLVLFFLGYLFSPIFTRFYDRSSGNYAKRGEDNISSLIIKADGLKKSSFTRDRVIDIYNEILELDPNWDINQELLKNADWEFRKGGLGYGDDGSALFWYKEGLRRMQIEFENSQYTSELFASSRQNPTLGWRLSCFFNNQENVCKKVDLNSLRKKEVKYASIFSDHGNTKFKRFAKEGKPEDLNAAINWYEEALKLDPENGGLHYKLGVSYYLNIDFANQGPDYQPPIHYKRLAFFHIEKSKTWFNKYGYKLKGHRNKPLMPPREIIRKIKLK